MNKLRFNALAKIFDAEIEGTLPYQSKSKIYNTLEQDGLVEKVKIKKDILIISGYVLTHKGRLLYCQNCKEDY